MQPAKPQGATSPLPLLPDGLRPYYLDERSGIAIIHGDCREVLPALALPADALVATDPPYGIAYSPGASNKKGWSKKLFVGDNLVRGDEVDFDPAHLLAFKRLILWGGNHYADKLPASPTWLVWDKRDGNPSNDFADCELAWSNIGGPARVFRHLWNGAFRASEKGVSREHPTQKSEAVMKWCLGLVPDAPLVVDPYMGSGTTLRAAKDLGRRAIGIEIEERYCEIAARRLSQEVLAL